MHFPASAIENFRLGKAQNESEKMPSAAGRLMKKPDVCSRCNILTVTRACHFPVSMCLLYTIAA